MLSQIDIEVYYVNGMTYIKLQENLFFMVSDDGQKRGQVSELPPNHLRTSPHCDNQGLTGSTARNLIATACEVAQAMKQAMQDIKKAS